jgi:hypothetical protein
MKCRELAARASDQIEGALPWRGRVLMGWHLLWCQDCRAFMRQLRVTVATMAKLPPESMPADLHDDLVRRFESGRL